MTSSSAEALSALLPVVDGFARPGWLWGLLAIGPYLFWRARRARWREVRHAPLQYTAAPTRRRSIRRLSPIADLALLALVVVALAAPFRQRTLELFESEGIDVMLVLDISLSMMADDFAPNRLAAATRIARDFVARGGGHRIGIVVFAGDSYVQSPISRDLGFVAALLEETTVHAISQSKSGGTALGDALLVATDELARLRRDGREQAILLITDGESNLGLDPSLAARYLAEEGMGLYIIGIGGREPRRVRFEGRTVGGRGRPYVSALDDARLEALARAAGGRYERADQVAVLESLFDELSRLESAPLESRVLSQRHALAPWLALLSSALFALRLWAIEGRLWKPIR